MNNHIKYHLKASEKESQGEKKKPNSKFSEQLNESIQFSVHTTNKKCDVEVVELSEDSIQVPDQNSTKEQINIENKFQVESNLNPIQIPLPIVMNYNNNNNFDFEQKNDLTPINFSFPNSPYLFGM
jgi:hypothetical protein